MPETLRAVAYLPPGHGASCFDLAVLRHDERRLQHATIELVHGDSVEVDFPAPIAMESRGALRLTDGRAAEIIAAEEPLYEIRGRDAIHLVQLAWHIGSLGLSAQIEPEWEGVGLRILTLREPRLRAALTALGARVSEISEPFHPQPAG
jgi:urease accessory protein